MTGEQVSWLAVVAALGVQVIAPYTLEFAEQPVTFTAFFPHYGGSSGTITDPEWSVIKPHTEMLILAGFGYSCVNLSGSDHESMREMLVDWGWNGPPEDRPGWM